MIEDALLRELKERAAKEGRSLQDVANDALRKGLRREQRPYKLNWKTWNAQLQPGVDICDRDRLFDLLDGRDD